MGAAESRPPPPSWLVEACETLDPREVDEVVTLARRAAKNAEASREPGASCPANALDAAAYALEQEERLGWQREAFDTPPALDAVLDRLARSVVAGDETTSGTRGDASLPERAAGDAKDETASENRLPLCAALASRARCRRAASGDGDAVASLIRAVFLARKEPRPAADRARDALEVARALASVALPPTATRDEANRRDAFLRRVAAFADADADDVDDFDAGAAPGEPPGDESRSARRDAKRVRRKCPDPFTTLLVQSAYDASMPSRRGRLVPDLTDEDGATPLFAALRASPSGAETEETYSSALIHPLSAWFLSRSMPCDWRTKWRRVFSSKTNGASFASFLRGCEDAGPTLVAVETECGFLVGGVVSHTLRAERAAFFGDARCFVFSLGRERGAMGNEARVDTRATEKKTDVDDFDFGAFRATGANDRFCYCARGFSSDRFPNGLGFGGQVGHHCVFLDAGFETGHWRAFTATFGEARLLPSLSAEAKTKTKTAEARGRAAGGTFRVRAVEAWAVDGDFKARLEAKRRAEKRRGAGAGPGGGVRSARHNEARALMEAARRDAGLERQERS